MVKLPKKNYCFVNKYIILTVITWFITFTFLIAVTVEIVSPTWHQFLFSISIPIAMITLTWSVNRWK